MAAVDEEVGLRLRALRLRRGLTLQELGDRLGMTRSGVGKWERGLSPISSTTLPILARELGVSVGELFGEDDAAKRTIVLDPNVVLLLGAGAAALLTDEDVHVASEFINSLLRMRGLMPEMTWAAWTTNYDALLEAATSDKPAVFEPTRADWDQKQLLERWESMTEDERRGWLEFASAIRSQEPGQSS